MSEEENKSMWLFWGQLILQEGVPLAEYVWKQWVDGKDPTAETWDVLKNLSQQTAKDRMTQALARSGLSPTDPRAMQLMGLTATP